MDVEEEGLFSGIYQRRSLRVENVRQLRRLEFIPDEFGLPLTLLTTYQVARDPVCREILTGWRDRWHAEIGAHLHHWNTPPFQDLPFIEPINSDFLPKPLLRAKLDTLLTELKNHMGVSPCSFRMGRFDLGKQVMSLLPEFGLRVDSSVMPLRRIAGSPDHFLAPCDPYLLQGDEDHHFGAILEVPLTQVGLFSTSRQTVHRVGCALPRDKGNLFFLAYQHLAVVGIHPALFPLASMKCATRLHRMRGGQVLTMFLHSSELQPGATPSFRSRAAVERLTGKIRNYLTWLLRTERIQGLTLSSLCNLGK